MTETIMIGILAVLVVLCIVILIRQNKKTNENAELRLEITSQFHILSGMMMDTMGKVSNNHTQSVEILRQTVEQKLSEIQKSVDQKLDSTLKSGLDMSFKRVSDQLSQVYQSMGEMRTLTSGIGDLKNILSNVKTRGIWGEVQLYKLLTDFMAPGQYIENAKIGDGVVEFAISMPREDRSNMLLPIDAKFPMDKYSHVLELIEQGKTLEITAAQKELFSAIITEAKKISEKYIRPPQTTDFAILFLPSEGLYSEAIRLGLIEKVQSKFKVMLTGPSTLCALLTSLQTGFKTLAIQKHSLAILDMMSAIKTEFDNFAEVLQKTQNSLSAAQNHLETVQKRTTKIQTKLTDVDGLKTQE
ncbi:MAG: DNA recombination protein RmuC [Christensenellaceae bacterium]